MKPQEINIEDYSYELPQERIAQHPIKQRDNSKLLIAGDNISDDKFSNISSYLPEGSLIIFNDTKVFHARLTFRKQTGARIEIFLLEPVYPVSETELAFQQKEEVIWKCLVGNLKKWKNGSLYSEYTIKGTEIKLEVNREGSEGNSQLIKFRWNNGNVLFGDIVAKAGTIPLPPYMNRPAEKDDDIRYQTIYAKREGSVAAPTAGLHFTDKVMDSLRQKNIKTDFVSLDVGAGTFKPVKASKMAEHQMHTEKVYVSRQTLNNITDAVGRKKIIAVGTTTTRTLESLYWFAMKLKNNPEAEFDIHQWEPYQYSRNELLPVGEALKLIENYFEKKEISILKGQTQLIIAPGYSFKTVDILITNFHQPKSTLLLLVAAFYGKRWKQAYEYALKNNFRFLSYGDSCIFIQ